jgi:hypothetical protein
VVFLLRHIDALQFSGVANAANEPVEKVTFLKSASSAGSKIGNYFLSSKVFPILGEMLVF